MPGTQAVASRATRETWARSLSSAGPAPGYWTLTATARPSRQMPRWTCPIDAAATGLSSNSTKLRRHRGPSCSASTAWTVEAGSGGALSCSLVSIAR